MKQLINGVEVKLTPEQAAEFESTREGLDKEPPVEVLMPVSGIVAGLKALGFSDEQVNAFTAAATAG